MADLGTRASTESPPVSALLTFLLADVRGYTRFAAEHGDLAASRLSERFLSLCRETISAHGGDVFGSAGDQALAAFSSAHAALRAALALQARLAQEQEVQPDLPLQAGIGLDTGEGMRIGSDYRGNAINLAARLCSIAGPGEIFASDTVIAVARVVEGMVAVDRGEVRLKGLSAPVRVIQIAPAGQLPEELPPLQPILVTHPTNLPDEPTPFIGRGGEIARIAELLRGPRTRLVTLTGAGGSGKTRLALQVGATLLHDFADGVFFVSLAALTDPGLVPTSIAQVVAVKEEGGKSLHKALIAHLQGKHLLLVLDNFEHLLDGSPPVAELLDACRNLNVLVTSRIPLHLSREREYPVPPLPVPDLRHLPSDPGQLSQYEAVALFIDRAQAVKPDFAITNENAPAVAEICHRLDGLPLAIELAAARIKLLRPQALLPRLSRRLQLLTGGARDLPARQQTLRNTIEWSYDLLTEQERQLFARLSVFVGGCSFEAAEAVCNPAGELDLLEGLASLVDKSLLRQEGEEEPRFRLLETIREYAAERLAERGEAAVCQEAHARFFLAVGEAAETELTGAEQASWLERLDAEHDNLRAALSWFRDRGDERFLALAGVLWRYWHTRGHFSEGRGWLEGAVAAWRDRGQDDQPVLLSRALNGAGNLAYMQGEYAQARRLHEEGLGLKRELGDSRGIAMSLNNLGIVADLQERYDDAQELYEESLGLMRELGNTWGIAASLGNLGDLASAQGRYDDAWQLLEESLRLRRELGDTRGIAASLLNLGVPAQFQGRYDEARELYEESLRLYREVGNTWGIAISLVGLGSLAGSQQQHERATTLVGAAGLLWESIGGAPYPDDSERMEQTLVAARDALSEQAYQAAWERGRAMSLEEATAFALEVGSAHPTTRDMS